MKNDATLYVHCGFPKTGSTALQAALHRSRDQLRQQGFLYPITGGLDRLKSDSTPLHTAHYNIARQIMRNYLFDPHAGGVSELAAEVERFSGNVIISCEDLVTVLDCPEKFSPLFNLATKTKRNFSLVVYLRDQISYCESLYCELLKHGSANEYLFHANEILETGSLRFKESIHHFDYERVLGKWKNIPNVKVTIRNYHKLTENSIMSDFAEAIDLSWLPEDHLRQRKINSRNENLESLKLFYENSLSRRAGLAERARIKRLAQNVTSLTSSVSLQQKFIERFQNSNSRLDQHWRLPTTGLDMKKLPRPQSKVTFEQFFSFETRSAIRYGVVPIDSNIGSIAPINWMDGIETAASNVSASETIRYWVGEAARCGRWYAYRIRNLLPFSRASSSFG